MAGRLAGRVAIVTGGAGGRGAAASRLFAAKGAAVGIDEVSSVDNAFTAVWRARS